MHALGIRVPNTEPPAAFSPGLQNWGEEGGSQNSAVHGPDLSPHLQFKAGADWEPLFHTGPSNPSLQHILGLSLHLLGSHLTPREQEVQTDHPMLSKFGEWVLIARAATVVH